MKLLILIFSILCLGAALMGITLKRTVPKKEMPENIEERFEQYCNTFLANIKISAKEVTVEKLRQIAEVPFEGGNFEFYRFNYTLIPSKAVTDKNGLVMTTEQLLERANFKDTPIMLFYRIGDRTCELTFVGETEIARHTDFAGYIKFRYADIKNPQPLDEYSMLIDGERIRLWENLRGNAPFEGAVRTRERNNDILNNMAQFSDTWEGKGIRISAWVQFETKLEMIYRIKIDSGQAVTNRGIHIGNTVEELKQAYPDRLAYDADFKGGGACYAYIPDDKSYRYIAFFVSGGTVREIWITDGLNERPFKMPAGKVDDDVMWEIVDNREKFSERHAREIYVGQHKTEFDVEKVFHSFLAKEMNDLTVIDTAEMRANPGEKMYQVIGRRKNQPATVYMEVLLKRVTLLNSVTGDEIWVVDKYRSQLK